MGDIKKGTLKSFEKKMRDGVHDVYDGANGRLYKFNVVFTIDGTDTSGECNSNKEAPSWKVGQKYQFEVNINGQYTNFKGLKALDENGAVKTGGGGGGNWKGRSSAPSANKMEFAVQKAVECAYTTTYHFWSLVIKNDPTKKPADFGVYKMPVSHFLGFLMGEMNENAIWLRIAAMNALCQRSEIIFTECPPDKKMVNVWIEQAFLILENINEYINKWKDAGNK